ncbi:HAMP domain-containing protein [Thalassomonas viridans]|uniref:histidine kinase n=1 Tax=Thalassomonas viridans TaxID=137584 RepID=A0AAE9Z7K6_9GAMM|nr:ATP-binding protein [Thalassomonas viridans]WDE07599.1 HAMP domain-containing protein [Thalassomonas viridans]
MQLTKTVQELRRKSVFPRGVKHFIFRKLFRIETLSIKKLTLLGFTLVALPLVLALLYSAAQVNQISKQGANAIFDVASLIKSNREINENLRKMERFASQYVVLKDEALKQQFLNRRQQLQAVLTQQSRDNQDLVLTSEVNALSLALAKIHRSFLTGQDDTSANDLTLEQLQQEFKHLATITQKINQRSNRLIDLQASYIKSSAEEVSSVILKGLVIIPVTILIAGFFIFLITKPMKLLTRKIQRLEQGDFEQKIILKGSPEIREIAEALEVMRTRLHALELQKSSFIRHISHELKTPLAAIREGTELLYDNSVGELNEGQQEICHIIKNSVQRLQRLIEDLLDFNIVLDSTSLQDSEKISLQQLLAKVLQERKLDIKRKQLTIKQDIKGICLHSNARQLHVILDNLLSNAIKYSPVNASISFDGEIEGNRLMLTISDQGPGISSEVESKVFDAFYQGPAPENNQIKGSGLGLTIVKELLMRLNGSIELTSNTLAPSGTRVSLTLPRAYFAGNHK